MTIVFGFAAAAAATRSFSSSDNDNVVRSDPSEDVVATCTITTSALEAAAVAASRSPVDT
eukprot:CAMPEP_0114352436 /NCGR_PEP_ID=MMETSP0101-20121206/17953_1 /TAXON_ID=38822 ORGANISM="Pteridomonas danica, Strain PT" /NCGR_SAMPLE_ID=MMETSP0101 /ASSEMBLY_ACC=CAM_ASM_000211 /LENGTH=59 /DNA_ID=CAMNT_0001492853 /DNA_START=138 /DNA_END=317 /DNA_ORIENTATION=+